MDTQSARFTTIVTASDVGEPAHPTAPLAEPQSGAGPASPLKVLAALSLFMPGWYGVSQRLSRKCCQSSCSLQEQQGTGF